MKLIRLTVVIFLTLSAIITKAQDTLKVKNVNAILYLGSGTNQPLVVGLGGSEGGNAWTSDHWKATRDQFIAKGYAFLAIGYFGAKNTPKILDQIAIEDVYQAITLAAKNQKVNEAKIAIVGGSRGADLALLLGSYYPAITCVVGLSGSSVAFPGHTQTFDTSCWTFAGKQLPFVPVNEAAVPFLMKGDLRGAFTTMLQDTVAVQKAAIKVEKINGPILLLSATKDEIIPAVAMGEQMVARLKANHFKHPYQHLVFEGTHAEPTKHFKEVFAFLDQYFMK
ncbi:MAG: alpha/beta hydrolase [Pedobacter sp.]|nr:MAG: alpha/beta hydrolase [Pedobacter sp.]